MVLIWGISVIIIEIVRKSLRLLLQRYKVQANAFHELKAYQIKEVFDMLSLKV